MIITNKPLPKAKLLNLDRFYSSITLLVAFLISIFLLIGSPISVMGQTSMPTPPMPMPMPISPSIGVSGTVPTQHYELFIDANGQRVIVVLLQVRVQLDCHQIKLQDQLRQLLLSGNDIHLGTIPNPMVNIRVVQNTNFNTYQWYYYFDPNTFEPITNSVGGIKGSLAYLTDTVGPLDMSAMNFLDNGTLILSHLPPTRFLYKYFFDYRVPGGSDLIELVCNYPRHLILLRVVLSFLLL